MKLFDKVARARPLVTGGSSRILDQVQRMVDEVIAPNASRIDETGEFPWGAMSKLSTRLASTPSS